MIPLALNRSSGPVDHPKPQPPKVGAYYRYTVALFHTKRPVVVHLKFVAGGVSNLYYFNRYPNPRSKVYTKSTPFPYSSRSYYTMTIWDWNHQVAIGAMVHIA